MKPLALVIGGAILAAFLGVLYLLQCLVLGGYCLGRILQ